MSLDNTRLEPRQLNWSCNCLHLTWGYDKSSQYSTKKYLASCDYWRYGAGGRQENINAICILNLNVINDKVIDTAW